MVSLVSFLQESSQNPAPDGWFYYAVTLGMGASMVGGLAWIISRYLAKQDVYHAKIDVFMDSIQRTVHDLTAIAKVHEEKHKQHESDIEEIKAGYVVKYQKKHR